MERNAGSTKWQLYWGNCHCLNITIYWRVLGNETIKTQRSGSVEGSSRHKSSILWPVMRISIPQLNKESGNNSVRRRSSPQQKRGNMSQYSNWHIPRYRLQRKICLSIATSTSGPSWWLENNLMGMYKRSDMYFTGMMIWESMRLR